MDIKQALNRISGQLDLNVAEMQAVMRQIMTGGADEAQIGAFLMGMRIKSETIDEICGAVSVMRELATPVVLPSLDHVVDVVGTGGDGANIFNVSSASVFVVAAAGGKVAKHGNRAVSGKSGSADLLEAAGIYLELTPAQIARCVEQVGVGFMFAQSHHSAMRHAAGPRRSLGLRTLFNMLGPLTNPAGSGTRWSGCSAPRCAGRWRGAAAPGQPPRAGGAFPRRPGRIQPGRATQVAELKDGSISEYQVLPEDLGIKSQTLVGLTVDGPEASLALIRDALGRRKTEAGQKAADMIVLNAGAALYAADLAHSLHEGVLLAHDALYSGLAREKLDELAHFTSVYREEGRP